MSTRGNFARGTPRLAFFFLFGLFALSSCTSVFYQPDKILYADPAKFGFKKQDILFNSGDGTRLLGWYFPATTQPDLGTIIQFHGNGENISTHSAIVAWLTRFGYSVFAFDYRGYGASSGTPDPDGVYLDGIAALNEAWALHSRLPSQGRRFVIVGQSLGGAIAMRVLDDFEHKKQVSLIVMDSTFLSYKTVARRKLASFWLTWPFSPIGALIVSDKYSAEAANGRNRVPLLVIHDKRDPVMPCSCGEDIFQGATGPKEFWTLDQGRHISAFSEDNAEWRRKFLEYLKGLKLPAN